MAKLVRNSVPNTQNRDWYKVVVATRKEFMAVFDDVCDCHLCGDDVNLDGIMYYIPVLDVVYCPRCYELWCVSAQYFKVDKPIEDKNLKKVVEKFEELGCWDEDA